MKKIVLGIACAVCTAVMADVQVFRLERDTETECLWLVGVDNVRRPVALISPDEYSILTGNLFQVWGKMNATQEGRRMLHGREVETAYDMTNCVKSVYYKDGYIHTEKFTKNTGAVRVEFSGRKTSSTPPEPVKPSGISQRQWEMRKRLAEARKAVPKQVTVEHDASTGKDIVK